MENNIKRGKLMSLKYGILGFLNYGGQTGYELDKSFKSSIDTFWHVTTSQIYRELTALEKDGLVRYETVIQTDKPNRKVFTITGAGKRELLEWLAVPQTNSLFYMRNSFLMQVFFSGERSKSDFIETLDQFSASCQQQINDTTIQWQQSIQSMQSKITEPEKSVFWLLTAEFGQRYLKSCIEWAESSKKLLMQQDNLR